MNVNIGINIIVKNTDNILVSRVSFYLILQNEFFFESQSSNSFKKARVFPLGIQQNLLRL